jgi:hypothetical protein
MEITYRWPPWVSGSYHPRSGGNLSIAVACASCANDTATIISDLTYGDVWFCAG